MKKVFALVIACLFVLVSGCSSEVSAEIAEVKDEIVEVKNGYLDLSVEEFENNFNAQLSKEYFRADLQKGFADEDSAFYSCDLETGIELSVSSTTDATMINYMNLSFDVNEDYADATKFGYYFAKLIYTVAPDITQDEISTLITELDMENPLPGDIETYERNKILFGLMVEDDGSKMHLTAITTK